VLAAGPTKRRGTNIYNKKFSLGENPEEHQPAADKNANTRALHKKKKAQRAAKKKEEKKSHYGVLLWRMKRERKTPLHGSRVQSCCCAILLSDMRERENVTLQGELKNCCSQQLAASFMLLLCALNLLLY
jgi:hypothetical protein